MQSVETLFREIHSLSPKERQKLFNMLEIKTAEKTNGNVAAPEKHFQATATNEEWKEALYFLANEPVINAPDISDEALRRENIYTREDNML